MCQEFKCFGKNREKETNFLLFVDTYMTFQVNFMQRKGGKEANLVDFLFQGMITASPETALQGSSQFSFN